MSEQTLRDHEELLASIRSRNEQLIAAGLRSSRELFEAMQQSLLAFAESQEQLADATEIEWLSRLLRAQAAFTRDIVEASGKFARELAEAA